jgi:pimeloyl-ACP methyl ester carboxylesterase
MYWINRRKSMDTKSRDISTEDGRNLRIIEAGLPDGIPILVHNGTPGSRLLYHPWVKDAELHGIRLISYDRPGYGGSTPQPGRTVSDAASDVAMIARELNLSRLSVYGYSGGGPHALACAALLPSLVVAVAALASFAPYLAHGLDWFAGMGEGNITGFSTAIKGRQAFEQLVEADAPGLLTATSDTLIQSFHSTLSPVDVAAMSEGVADYMLSCYHEGIQERRDGWIDDGIAFMKGWGFDLSQIQIPVMIMHGEQDKMVPFSHGKWLANNIPNVNAQLLPKDGHLSLGAHHIPDVHAWLLSKM